MQHEVNTREQCHVVSWRKKLETDLSVFRSVRHGHSLVLNKNNWLQYWDDSPGILVFRKTHKTDIFGGGGVGGPMHIFYCFNRYGMCSTFVWFKTTTILEQQRQQQRCRRRRRRRRWLYVGLPDLPYFTGDPVFQPLSPASRKEAVRETESPVFDYRLIQIGRMTAFDYLYILILIMINCFGFQMWLFHSF